ncbi:MAG: sugar phosphate isomerase/epimerase [Clostridiales bacterium]|nr:sugar phosphate isomerase/epimerase [Clostridiales bacterium]
MKITAHVEIVGAGLPYEKAFPLLRKLGAQGVELVVKDTAPLNLASTDGDFLRAKRLAEDEGLVISGASNGYSWSLPMTSDSAKTRDAGARALRRVLEGTALLGADSLLVVPGYARTEFYTPSEVIPVDTSLERAYSGICQGAEYARSVGVSMNVEVVWSGMLRTPEAMRAFLERVHSPAAGFYMDTGNVYPEGDPLHWIRVMGPHIRRVHMKDFDPQQDGMSAFCPLGEGVVDFPAVVCALREAGYGGWLGAEHHGNRTEEGGGHSLSFLRALVD